MIRLGVVLFLCVVTTTESPAQPFRRLRPQRPATPPPAPALMPRVTNPPVIVNPPGPHTAFHFEAKRDVVVRWNELALESIREERTPPPVAAHHLALLHVAIYDAVNATEPNHSAFVIAANAPRGASAEAAAAAAAWETLVRLFPKRSAIFDRAVAESLAWVPEGPAKTDGVNAGRTIAKDVIEWRVKNGKLDQVSYKPGAEPGRWQPTPPNFREALLPEWATLQGLALRDTSQFRAPGPPALTSDEFARSYEQVKQLGAATNSTRTGEQTVIAYFWADGEGTVTPPGHWNRIAASIAEKRGLSLAENARLFAMLNVAMSDAAICCWGCKYKCDYWRPVTAIRGAVALKSAKLAADAEWTPLLPTPPFPAYTSGHSTFSGAAAASLAKFFGTDDVSFTSTSDAVPNYQRSFKRFSDAAAEAGMSRIYGGIHWDFDNTDGLKLGKEIAEFVVANHFKARPAKQ